MTEPKIAILGCGFAGAALALFLKARGLSPTIYELRSQEYTHGGNIALAPNALRVLDHLFLYERIRDQGFNYSELRFDTAVGKSLGKFLNGSKSHYNYEAVRIHRDIVIRELRKRLEAENVLVHWSQKCVEVCEKDDKVQLTFESGTVVTADYVIGADGIHSAVRRYIAPETNPEFSGLMGIMGHVDKAELSLEDLADLSPPNFMFGASGAFAIMPSSYDGNEIGYFATIEAEDRSRESWAKLETDKGQLAQMLADRFLDETREKWSVTVRELVEKTPPDTLTSWPFNSVPHLDRWFSPSGRVICLGDSCHAIPPTGGQGAAMALEDAESLSHTLAYIFSPHFAMTQLSTTLGAWQKYRDDRIAKIVDFTSKNGNLRKAAPHRYEQAAKEWLIWAAFKWMGEEGGAHWMYSYNAESVRAVLP